MELSTAIAAASSAKKVYTLGKSAINAVRSVGKLRLKRFLDGFAPGDPMAETKLTQLLDDPEHQEFTFDFVESALRSGSKIAPLALGRILGTLSHANARYTSYEASKALRAIRELDDVEARMFVLTIEVLKNSEKRVQLVASPTEPVSANITLARLLEADRGGSLVPNSIHSEEDFGDLLARLMSLGLFRSPQGTLDMGEHTVAMTGFTFKVHEDLLWAADRAGYTVARAAHP